MSEHFVIIGDGAAGFRAAKALRRADSAAQVTIFSDEPYPFYLRRQIGELLAGTATVGELVFQGRNAYRRERLDLFLATKVAALDPAHHEIVLGSGERVRYDRLLLATGTTAAPPVLPGASLGCVVRFDTLARALEARQCLQGVGRAVLLGEGVVAQMAAECLSGCDVHVTQLILGDRLWPAMLDEGTSAVIEGLLEDHGVALLRNAKVHSLVGAGGRVIGVQTEQGDLLPAELVVCGSERRAHVELAREAGIETGHGIRVDARFQTSRADIFAAGDVAEPVSGTVYDDAFFCWQRAWTHGHRAGLGMLDRGGEPLFDVLRLRTTVFGRELAVIGAGHLPEGDDVGAMVLRDGPDVFRRLVFKDGRLAGAIIFGTGQHVFELSRMVAEGVARETVEAALGPVRSDRRTDLRVETFACHCPICAAELVVHRGTPVGATLRCRACSTDLVVSWDGRRGWLEVVQP